MPRLLHGLLSRIDSMVARVENHEALVESALGDERARLARAQHELDRVRARAASLDVSWRGAVAEQQSWHERARSERNETLALEYLRRSKRVRARAQEVSEQCHHHAELQRRLEALVVRLTERLSALEEQRERMQSREADAALRGVRRSGAVDGEHDVQSLLSRWEATVEEPAARRSLAEAEAYGFSDEPLGDEEVFLKLELDELRRDRK